MSQLLQLPAPRHSSLFRAAAACVALASRRAFLHNLPSRQHPDLLASPGRAHGQTARRGSGRSENAETQARARVYTREHEHMRARMHTGASALACARSRTVSMMMNESEG